MSKKWHTSEYIDILTKDPNDRQNLSQSVEFTRKRMNVFKKSTVQESFQKDFNF